VIREAGQRDGDEDEEDGGDEVRREVAVLRRELLRERRRTATSRRTIDVSFCRPTKSFRSGGITRRTACGMIT
jgi:hypothetical protein